jgi:chorismate lyase
MPLAWYEERALDQHPIDPVLRYWLVEPECLTQTLERHYKEVSVDLLSMGFDTPNDDEEMYLAPHHQSNRFVVRDIYLRGDGQALTYARVIIPENTYLNNKADFDTLNTQPIGETLLFGKPHVRRSCFQWALVDKGTYRNIIPIAKVVDHHYQQPLGARRSLFFIRKNPLLISEYYLPVIQSLELNSPVKIT